jgi:hypothetical protein
MKGESTDEKILEIIANARDTFFSNPNSSPVVVPASDENYRLSGYDVKKISSRLNQHPNLFGVVFYVSIHNVGNDYQLVIKGRRAA